MVFISEKSLISKIITCCFRSTLFYQVKGYYTKNSEFRSLSVKNRLSVKLSPAATPSKFSSWPIINDFYHPLISKSFLISHVLHFSVCSTEIILSFKKNRGGPFLRNRDFTKLFVTLFKSPFHEIQFDKLPQDLRHIRPSNFWNYSEEWKSNKFQIDKK